MNNRTPRPRLGVTRLGVTLIEVVLAIMIIGAAALATSFAFDAQWTSRRQARASTIDVSRLLSLAHNTAMEKRTTVHVSYSGKVGAGRIDIVEEPGPLTPGRKWSAPLSPSVSVQGQPNPINFLADGSADSALTWQVAAEGVQGEVYVSPIGGAVQHKVPE